MASFIATTEKSPKGGKSTPSFWTEVYVKGYVEDIGINRHPHLACHKWGLEGGLL